jgi:hypothetical protein
LELSLTRGREPKGAPLPEAATSRILRAASPQKTGTCQGRRSFGAASRRTPSPIPSKRRQPFTSPIPNVQHIDPLFAFVAHEVQVPLRFLQQHALELRAPVRWTGRAGIADCLEVLDHFQHLLEENLGGNRHFFASVRRFARLPAGRASIVRPSSVLGSQLGQEVPGADVIAVFKSLGSPPRWLPQALRGPREPCQRRRPPP